MFRDGKTDFPGTTMAGFARNLSMLLDRDVIDKTRITGFYDVHLDVRPVPLPADDSEPSDDAQPASANSGFDFEFAFLSVSVSSRR